MFRHIVFAALLSAAFACEAFPNNTQATLNWWQCEASPITLHNITLVGDNSEPVYPVKLTKPLKVLADIDNQGKVYGRVSLSIRLWTWDTIFGCGWLEFPTFGLLDGRDACAQEIKCPVTKGRQTIEINIDFTQFNIIIRLLKNNAPYQIEIHLEDEDSDDNICVRAQARALTR